jgi:hypothetical protein
MIPAASSEGHKITSDAAKPGTITLLETKFRTVRIASLALDVSFAWTRVWSNADTEFLAVRFIIWRKTVILIFSPEEIKMEIAHHRNAGSAPHHFPAQWVTKPLVVRKSLAAPLSISSPSSTQLLGDGQSNQSFKAWAEASPSGCQEFSFEVMARERAIGLEAAPEKPRVEKTRELDAAR